jgi:hypothetical protein
MLRICYGDLGSTEKLGRPLCSKGSVSMSTAYIASTTRNENRCSGSLISHGYIHGAGGGGEFDGL